MNLLPPEQVRSLLIDNDKLPEDLIHKLYQQGTFHIWVSPRYHGLGCSLVEGLRILAHYASIDGSLGWSLTLCSGANYFLNNIHLTGVEKILQSQSVILGGSGTIGGVATICEGGYRINGRWKYATGSDFLSHFTLNAYVSNEEKAGKLKDTNEEVRSFVIPRDQVRIIKDWKGIGMKASSTYSFEVVNAFVPEDMSFQYDDFYDDEVARVPFVVFADLTLLVNYIGLTLHFNQAYQNLTGNNDIYNENRIIQAIHLQLYKYADIVQKLLDSGVQIDRQLMYEIHQFGIEAVSQMVEIFTDLYLRAGIKATEEGSIFQKIRNDFFTITQHGNFRK